MKMKKLSEYLFMGALGGTLYYMIEIIFRGYSHWSMFLLGGICFIFFAQQGLWTKWREPLWKQVLWCTAFVVSAEFITGIIVNNSFKHSTNTLLFYGSIAFLDNAFNIKNSNEQKSASVHFDSNINL